MNISSIANNLRSKQQELETRMAAIKADFQQGRSQDFSEQTSESENDETLNEIYLEAEHELAQVKTALNRIGQGLYGICSQCNDAIPTARLNALPYTSNCISCADKDSI